MQGIIAEQRRMIEQFRLLSAETDRLLAEREHAHNRGISAGSSAAQSPPPAIASAPPSPATTSTAEREAVINQMIADGWRFTDEDIDQPATSLLGTQQPVAEPPQSVIATQQPAISSAELQRGGSNIFTDDANDSTLQNNTHIQELFMPAESQPQPNLECGQLSLHIDDTPMSHSSDVYLESDMNLEDQEVMISPECLYDLKLISHSLEELGGVLTSTTSKQDGFGASNTFITSSQPSFPFDPGNKHCQVFFINCHMKADAKYLFTCVNRKHTVLGSNMFVVRRPMWIHFPFDVKHYRWSELVLVRLGT